MKYFVRLTAAFASLCVAAVAANAQDFPKKQPIKIVVAVPPGAFTDTYARITAEFLQQRIGQAVVVENRPGAAAAIGIDYVAKSAPDGYTLLMAGGDLAVLPALRNDLPYKFNELTYLYSGYSLSTVLLAGPKFPATSVQDLIAQMKANPGKVRYGTPGVGSIVHLGFAMLESAAGVKGAHVTYTGSGPIYTDLLGGNIDITMGGMPMPDGLKVLGSMGTKRSPQFPNTPTVAESGLKGASWDIWFGLVAPPNTPKVIVDYLIAEIGAVHKDPAAVAKFTASLKMPPDQAPMIGEAFKKRAIDDNAGWRAVVEREKISVPK